ncbi:MAG: peptide-methionine (S)-S-oxide reductase MsrA [Hyphomicrobium sp.]|jgi:methionine-S-sulfoxide reductase
MRRLIALTAVGVVTAAAFALSHPSLSAPPVPDPAEIPAGLEVATFAGGCFWSAEYDFDKVPGVKQTISGFMGGHTKSPTYAEVSRGGTGHAESVQVTYDPKVVSYDKLVDYYWRHVDLLDGGGQFCDRGDEYRPVIFAHTPEQKRIAEESKTALDASHRFSSPIAVKIEDAGPFTAAEDYHQNFHVNNEAYYKRYRIGCRRDARLKEIWGAEADTAAH